MIGRIGRNPKSVPGKFSFDVTQSTEPVDNAVHKWRDQEDSSTEFSDLPRFEAAKIPFDPLYTSFSSCLTKTARREIRY